MEKDKANIIDSLISILHFKFNILEEYLIPKYYDAPLTGKDFELSAVSLIYLFFEIEKLYKIRIPHVMLDEYGFSSINKITDIIYACVL